MAGGILPDRAERFWAKVDRSGECWVWTGARLPRGYGKLARDGRHWLAHRLAWEMEHGPVPEGLFVLHRCDNPACVRPDHLRLGTHQDNMDDMHAKGRGARGERHGRYTRPESVLRGEANGSAKLDRRRALEIRERYAAGGISQVRLAAEYGVGQMTVSRIVRGERWAHLAAADGA